MSEQKPQTFRQWLNEQTHRRDPIGDLARDVQADRPGARSVDDLRLVLQEHDASANALDALERAAQEYGQP